MKNSYFLDSFSSHNSSYISFHTIVHTFFCNHNKHSTLNWNHVLHICEMCRNEVLYKRVFWKSLMRVRAPFCLKELYIWVHTHYRYLLLQKTNLKGLKYRIWFLKGEDEKIKMKYKNTLNTNKIGKYAGFSWMHAFTLNIKST